MATAGTKARAAPAGRARFDIAARARIRAAMLRYMEAHRIGVPTLQARISEATDRPVDLIPLKTLQRFLAGASRTNDAFLIPCHQFASSLPDYAGPQEAGPDNLARALRAYFMLPEAAPGRPASAQPPLASAYGVFAPAGGLGLRVREGDEFPVPYAHLSISDALSGGPAIVREEVFNPASAFPFKPEDGQPRHLYEGALLRFDAELFVLMKNLLTRTPKSYGLICTPTAELGGYSFEAPFAAAGSLIRRVPPRYYFQPQPQKPAA